jgi:hypothetical protein
MLMGPVRFIRIIRTEADMGGRDAGSWVLAASRQRAGEDGIMGLFRRPRQTARNSQKPTWRERRAAERTARAETALVATEQRIHQIADEVRSDLKGSA